MQIHFSVVGSVNPARVHGVFVPRSKKKTMEASKNGRIYEKNIVLPMPWFGLLIFFQTSDQGMVWQNLGGIICRNQEVKMPKSIYWLVYWDPYNGLL